MIMAQIASDWFEITQHLYSIQNTTLQAGGQMVQTVILTIRESVREIIATEK